MLINKNINDFLLKNILVMFFAYDFLIKIIVYFTNIALFYNYVIVFKALLIALLIFNKGVFKLKKQYFLIPVLLSIAYLVTQACNYTILNTENINFNGYYFLSSIVPILFVFYFYDIEKSIVDIQINRVLYFLIFSSAFVFIGYILDIDLFMSYFRQSKRQGYSGFLLYHHEAGYIFFLASTLLYEKYKKNKTKVNLALFLLLFVSSLLVGTKKALFFSIIFLAYVVIDNIRNIKAVIFTLSTTLIAVLIFFKDIKKLFLFFYKFYLKSGFWTSFLSHRDKLFTQKFLPYVEDNLTLTNSVFGWPIFNTHRTEMEVFDLFLFFGVVGYVCYIIFFTHLLRKRNKLTYFIVISLLIATMFSGNLFASVNVMVMLFLVIIYVNNQKRA